MAFRLSIITPERVFFSGEANLVTAPGAQGEFGVLSGHSPFISVLKPGVVTVEGAQGRQCIAVLDGVAEVTQDHCSILADVARSLEGVSPAEAQAQLKEARDAYESAYNEEGKARAAQQLKLAEIIAAAV